MKKNYNFNSAIIIAILFISMRVGAQCTFTSSVPYYQGFQSLTAINQLPTCWSASNLGTTCLTYTTPSQYAAFSYSPAGANYFYTNGIQLYTGVTYSTALFYKTDNTGSLNWTDLSILLGSTQTTVGQSTIASTNGPAANPIYALLSGTFTVASSGIYYVAIRGTGNTSGTSQYLYWDDLSITIPCNLSPNSPTLTLSPSTVTLCSGFLAQPSTVTASGASTYSWSSGELTATLTIPPVISSSNFTVFGTNTLTGCTSSKILLVLVAPSPNVLIYNANPSICLGESTVLNALGATTSSWSTGANSQTIVVSPTVTTTYFAFGTNSSGCTGVSSCTVTVKQLPTITVTSSNFTFCAGESATLSANGAFSYTWSSGNGVVSQTSVAVVSPSSTSTYTAFGIDANGCTNNSNLVLNVNACTGLNNTNSINSELKIFPNPTSGDFTIEVIGNKYYRIDVIDVLGNFILKESLINNSTKFSVNINDYPKGIYFLKAQNNSEQRVYKIIKE